MRSKLLLVLSVRRGGLSFDLCLRLLRCLRLSHRRWRCFRRRRLRNHWLLHRGWSGSCRSRNGRGGRSWGRGRTRGSLRSWHCRCFPSSFHLLVIVVCKILVPINRGFIALRSDRGTRAFAVVRTCQERVRTSILRRGCCRCARRLRRRWAPAGSARLGLLHQKPFQLHC